MNRDKNIASDKEEMVTSTYLSLREKLKGLARRLLRNDEEADDALQETFSRLWSHRDEMESSARTSATAVTTLRNFCIDRLRERSRHPQDSIDSLNTEPSYNGDETGVDQEMIKRVNALIATRLSPIHREILWLREHDGWAIDDLAKKYDTSESNIRVILSRARTTIREAYRNKDK